MEASKAEFPLFAFPKVCTLDLSVNSVPCKGDFCFSIGVNDALRYHGNTQK